MIQIFTQLGRTTEVEQRVYHAIAEQSKPWASTARTSFIGIVENGPQDWTFGLGRAQYTEGDLPVPGH
ncbi:hypothetical protein ACFW95_20275 [Streptomyces sp. NPDC059474]|uniref:hypothetical protein n=1 Tax=Streptomyces sp. NPDC059474 TaxID=3346846 RepID=UPI00367E5458